MLSSLPKLADKAFILGFFLPTLLLSLAVAALFFDQSFAQAVFKAATQKDEWDQLALFVLAVWALSILAMMINQIAVQMLEGYRWPLSKLPFLKRRELKRFEALNQPFQTLNEQWILNPAAFGAKQKKQWERLRKTLVQAFPADPQFLLPTRLGNAIRAFELYSKDVYGADSIPLWLHLSAVVSKEFQTALDDARAQFNCAINICFFAACVSLLAAIRVVAPFDASSLVFIGAAVLAALISRLAYIFSIHLAYAWGDLVKAAFDCFLPDLAKKLGYELPKTGHERLSFWTGVSEQSIYWRPLTPEDWTAAKSSTPKAGPDGE